MRLTEEQTEMLFSPAKNGLIATKFRWPNKTVPYTLPKALSTPQKIQTELALKTLESVSCVKFVERTDETDYVEVIVSQQNLLSFSSRWNYFRCFQFFLQLGPSGRGCYSYVGRVNGKQRLGMSNDPVDKGCFRLGKK